MDSENEKQFGRRRSFKRAMVPKKNKATNDDNPQEEMTSRETPAMDTVRAPGNEPDSGPKEEKSAPAERPPRKPRSESRERRSPRGKTERQPRGDRGDRQRRSSPRKTGYPDSRVPRSSGGVKLSVIIPAYNEEGNINELLAQFDEVFRNLPYKAEMVLVDDGSVDKTLVVAKDSQSRYKWLRVYSHRINRGLTLALETGFSKASGKILCFYPADLQYHANEIPRMVSRIDSGADVVTGWKQGKYGKSVGSFIYNKLSRWMFNVKVHDLNSIKMFKREVADCFTFRQGWHRYMVVMAAQAGYNIDEVKVKLYPRKSGKSKFGMSQLPIGFLDLLSVKFELSFTTKPLLFFGSAGILCGLAGFIIGLFSLYLRFVEHAGFRPLLYAVILLVIAGLLLFAIGFLAELIVSVKEKVERRR